MTHAIRGASNVKSYLESVPEHAIRRSAENSDLDAALVPIMSLLGITEGDVASHAFSHTSTMMVQKLNKLGLASASKAASGN